MSVGGMAASRRGRDARGSVLGVSVDGMGAAMPREGCVQERSGRIRQRDGSTPAMVGMPDGAVWAHPSAGWVHPCHGRDARRSGLGVSVGETGAPMSWEGCPRERSGRIRRRDGCTHVTGGMPAGAAWPYPSAGWVHPWRGTDACRSYLPVSLRGVRAPMPWQGRTPPAEALAPRASGREVVEHLGPLVLGKVDPLPVTRERSLELGASACSRFDARVARAAACAVHGRDRALSLRRRGCRSARREDARHDGQGGDDGRCATRAFLRRLHRPSSSRSLARAPQPTQGGRLTACPARMRFTGRSRRRRRNTRCCSARPS